MDKALKIVLRLAKILSYAHKESLFHGDISPRNIIISETGKVVLINLGIPTKVVKDVFAIAQKQGKAPLYLAPEHLLEGQTPDHRSDIYSLGILLYQLLAGAPPLMGSTPFDALNRLTESTPLPPLQIYNAEVSGGLVKIIEKMAAPEMEDRYQNYSELLMDLRNPDRSKSAQDSQQQVQAANAKADNQSIAPHPPLEVIDSTEEVRREEESIKQWTSRTGKASIPWGRILVAGILIAVVGWGIINYFKTQAALRNAEDEYYKLRRYYKNNYRDPSKWDKMEKQLNEFTQRHRNVKFPEYQPGRTISKDVETILNKLKRQRERHFKAELKHILKTAQTHAKQSRFCVALEILAQAPDYLRVDKAGARIDNLQKHIQNQAQAAIKDADNTYKEAIKQHQFKQALEKIPALAESLGKDAKSPGKFKADIQRLKKYAQELQKARRDYKLEQQKKQEKMAQKLFESIYQEVKIHLDSYDYSRARYVLRQKLYQNERRLDKKRLGLLHQLRSDLNTLVQARDLIISGLKDVRHKNFKVQYNNKTYKLLNVNKNGFLLTSNIRVSWSNYPKESLAQLLDYLVSKIGPQQRLTISEFAKTIKDYKTAYRILTVLAKNDKSAKEKLKQMQKYLGQQIEEYFNHMQEAFQQNKINLALKNALIIREKYLLPGYFSQKYGNRLDNFFLRMFQNLYGSPDGRHKFLTFTLSDQLRGQDIQRAKLNIKNGQLEYVRGNFSLKSENISAIAGLCRLGRRDNRLSIKMGSKRPIYAMQMRGNGRVSYNVYHSTGGVKFEKVPELEREWFVFAIAFTRGRAYWYLGSQKRYSCIHPANVENINNLQFQGAGIDAVPILLDNIYIQCQK